MSTPSETGPQAVQEYLRADEPRGWMLLLDPFRRIEGTTALLLGLVVVGATVLLGVEGRIVYNGVADVNICWLPEPAYVMSLMPMMEWLIAVLILGLAGRLFSRSRQRLVDYLGMLAVARLPLVIMGVLSLQPLVGKQLLQIAQWTLQNPQSVNAQPLLQFPGPKWFAAVSIVLAVWNGFLTYYALKEASGMSRWRAILVFLAAAYVASFVGKLAAEALMGVGL
jgi:hypothetical protein